MRYGGGVATDDDPLIAELRARLARLDEEIMRLGEDRARTAAALEALTSARISANAANMHPITQQLYSVGAKSTPDVQRLLDALHEAGIPSLRALAVLARKKFDGRKISQATFSFAVHGIRPIDHDLAEWVQEVAGYKATKRNWPKLRQPKTASLAAR
jgi:uncharacterized small protein (DUF1192 family)